MYVSATGFIGFTLPSSLFHAYLNSQQQGFSMDFIAHFSRPTYQPFSASANTTQNKRFSMLSLIASDFTCGLGICCMGRLDSVVTLLDCVMSVSDALID